MNARAHGAMIPITRPTFGPEEEAATQRVLTSGWILQGPEVAAFERELAAYLGARDVCVVSSGTAALHLALVALGIGAGDEVVTVSHSFIATANAVRLAGAKPVFVDIEPATLNLDVRRVDGALTQKTRAILCVHQLGMPCELGALGELARSRGLFLIEDAACAIGSMVELDGTWQRIGRPHSDAATFSFHPRKLVTTGDGGALVMRDGERLARARRLRQHGTSDGLRFDETGFNYRMTDLQAAVGRVQLTRLPALLERRRALVDGYARRLVGSPFEVPKEPPGRRSNWQSFCVRTSGRDARAIVKYLDQVGIGARPGIVNAHEQPAYAGSAPLLPESERASRETLMLPLYDSLDDEEQDRVVAALRAAP